MTKILTMFRGGLIAPLAVAFVVALGAVHTQAAIYPEDNCEGITPSEAGITGAGVCGKTYNNLLGALDGRTTDRTGGLAIDSVTAFELGDVTDGNAGIAEIRDLIPIGLIVAISVTVAVVGFYAVTALIRKLRPS